MFLLRWWHKEGLSPQAQLMKTFKFNEEDLESNRGGVLSDDQSQSLIEKANTWIKAGRLAGLYVFISCLLFLLAQHPQSNLERVSGFLIAAGVTGIPAFFAWRLKRDVNNKTVLSVTGMIEIKYNKHSDTIIVRTGASQEWFVSRYYRYGTLQPKNVYTLYYLPITRRIVAAELITT